MSQLSGNSRHQVREPSGLWLTAQEVSRLYEQSSGVLGFRQTWAAPVLSWRQELHPLPPGMPLRPGPSLSLK